MRVARSAALGPASVVLPGGHVFDGYVSVDAGRIVAIEEARPSRFEVIDVGGGWLAPGFVDLHVHGGMGATFMDGTPDAVAAAARFHLAHGTTALVATTWTASRDALERAVRSIVAADAANVVGVHLEGPFLSPARRGAQPGQHLRPPDQGELAALLHAGAGSVRLMTLAPELPGARALITQLRDAGAVAALGHTDATYDQTIAAIDAGAAHATHLCNGMRPLHHREPGPIAAFLERVDTTAEVIADGRHVSPAALRLIHRAKGSAGLALVTDALGVAGLGDGSEDAVWLADGSTLAGSAMTMERAVENAVRFLDIPVPEAAAMASEVPARVIGLEGRKGTIAVGADADLVVLDHAGAVRRVMLGGTWMS